MADKDELKVKIGELENQSVYLNEVRNIDSDWIKKIDKIKGIGPETVKDIKRIYKSENELINAINSDSVPLRNDVVKILRGKFL